jgi:uncharacterized membrane protein YdjX (TVP38/TMEM64 family)
MTRARLRAAALALMALLAMVSVGLCVRWLGGPSAIRQRFGVWGILVAFVAHALLNLTPAGEIVPMAVANGAVWGFWLGATISWLGWIAASLAQYALVIRIGAGFDVQSRLEQLPGALRRFPVAHPVFQILGRCVPWVGLHLVNVASAVRGVPLRRFTTCAAIGQVGPALVMAAIGAGLVSLF